MKHEIRMVGIRTILEMLIGRPLNIEVGKKKISIEYNGSLNHMNKLDDYTMKLIKKRMKKDLEN